MHSERSPLAGKFVTVKAKLYGASEHQVHTFHVEDWWDKMTGGSWMDANGNPAAMNYAIRSGFAGLPLDNEVLYGKVGGLGYLVHVSEIQED
jgi:hypothetical protein